MTRPRIDTDELRKLLGTATQGKWKRGHIHDEGFPNHTHLYSELGRRDDGIMQIKTIAHLPKRGTPDQTTADAELMTLAPELADELIRLRAHAEAMAEALSDMVGGYEEYEFDTHGKPVLRPIHMQSSWIQRARAALTAYRAATKEQTDE